MKLKLTLIFLFIHFNISAFALEFTMGATDWPPSTGKSLPDYGTDSILVEKIFASQGIEFNVEFYPWGRLLNMAKNGDILGIFIIYKTLEREKYLYYSEPMGVHYDSLFYNKDKVVTWDDYKDLKDLVIGTTIGYSYGQEFDKKRRENIFITQDTKTEILNLRKLLLQRVDAFACTISVCEYFLDQHFADDKHKIAYTKKTLSKNISYAAFSKNHEQGREALIAFNKGLKALNISIEE